MVTDFVRDGRAWIKCTECNAELILIQHTTGKSSFNVNKSIEQMQAFYTQHALCKKLQIQKEIDYNHYLEDGVMWYVLDMDKEWYKSLSINEKINFKQSYFDMST